MNQILLHFFFLLFINLLNINVVYSATPASEVETSIAVTPEFLQSKIEALNARQGLEESTKTSILKLYQSAHDNLTSNVQVLTRIAAFNTTIHQAPIQTKALQKEIEQTIAKQGKQKTEDFHQIPVEELEQRLIIEKGKVSQIETQLKKLEADLVQQNNRPTLIREETVVAQQAIEETRKKLELSAAPADSKLEYEARQLYYKTLIENRTIELKLLETEALSQPPCCLRS